MNNRIRLGNMCTYDFLVQLQRNLSSDNRCVLDMISSSFHRCIYDKESKKRKCEECIQQWLNSDKW